MAVFRNYSSFNTPPPLSFSHSSSDSDFRLLLRNISLSHNICMYVGFQEIQFNESECLCTACCPTNVVEGIWRDHPPCFYLSLCKLYLVWKHSRGSKLDVKWIIRLAFVPWRPIHYKGHVCKYIAMRRTASLLTLRVLAARVHKRAYNFLFFLFFWMAHHFLMRNEPLAK